MNKEEIQEALKIIREPITVNNVNYKYFDEENYNKLVRVYENCQWFIDNWEQFEQNIDNLQKKAELGKQYKSYYEKEKYLVDKLTRQLTDEYKNTEKQTEKAEHYKHLYSEVKKQKDDVVEYAKKLKLLDYEMGTELLRMLGEIDVED